MKRTIQTFFLFFLFYLSFGQKNKDYSLYHEKCLAIDECNARGSFDSALVQYFDLFSTYDRILAKDALNACMIAALKKHKYFSEFYYKCATTGITKARLLSSGLIKYQYYLDSVKLNALYLKGYAKYLNRIDTALTRELWRREELEGRSVDKRNYLEVCSDNFCRILKLAEQGKFPGENLIGNPYVQGNIIFTTICYYPYSYNILKPYLEGAVREGKLTPLALLYVYSHNQTRRGKLYTPSIPIDTVNFKIIYNLPFGSNSTDIDEVNRQRRLKKVISIEVEEKLLDLPRKYGVDYILGYH